MKTIKLIELFNKIANKEETPEKIKYDETIYIKDNDGNMDFYYSKDEDWRLLLEQIDNTNYLNENVEIIEEVEEDEIEIPQEFLADVNSESEIVLIKDDIGHDYGYKNSIGFLTDKLCLEGSYVFSFDKRANRWWECRFDRDEYIRTGLFVSDLIHKPFKVEPLEDEFEDIKELNLDTDELLKKVVITAQDYVIEGKINELIKNQKKIIERLNK